MPHKEKVIGIIPARYGSSRLPGKPLLEINGKTLIQRTYENACQSKALQEVVIATDDERILDHVKNFGGHVVMTSDTCETGTDRLAEAISQHPPLKNFTAVVNIQGDEPCLEPHVIEKVTQTLLEEPDTLVSTAIVPLTSEKEAYNPSVCKCVTDQDGYALYFSRNLIPAGKTQKFRPEVTYYKHLGIYAYRREFLLHYADLTPTPLQQAEDLEQLKILEHGFRIRTVIVESSSIGIDTPEDIKKVEQHLCKQSSSS